MIVAHCDKPATLQYQMGRQEVVDTVGGRVQEITKSRVIVFNTMNPGIPTTKIKTRMEFNGRLPSFIDTEVEAERLGITDAELINWLEDHPSWNERMLAVDSESTQVVGDKEGLGDGITAVGEGSYQCIPCDKYIRNSRRLAAHKNSKAHKTNMDALRGDPVALSA